MSRDKVWRCLITLQNSNIISWEKNKGKSNWYTVLPEGVWSKKVVSQEDYPSQPGRLPPVSQEDSNKTNLNKTKLRIANPFLQMVGTLKKENERNRGK